MDIPHKFMYKKYLRKVERKSAEQDDHMYRPLPPLSTASIMKSESAGQSLFSPSCNILKL